jgi:hypothetical protein
MLLRNYWNTNDGRGVLPNRTRGRDVKWSLVMPRLPRSLRLTLSMNPAELHILVTRLQPCRGQDQVTDALIDAFEGARQKLLLAAYDVEE